MRTMVQRHLAALRAAALDPWTIVVMSIAALLALPVVAVLSFVFYPAGEVWRHLVHTVLAAYVLNSVV